MKDKNLRICKAAIGRVLIDLIDRAEECDWSTEQLGATIRAVRQYISDAGCASDDCISDNDLYRASCGQIDRSESRSRKARERWQRKKSGEMTEKIESQTAPDEIQSESMEVAGEVAPQIDEQPEMQTVTPERIVSPDADWNNVTAILNGIVEVPKQRPVYPAEVPDHLRAYGVISYEEYVRNRYYADGLRGDQLENRVSDLTFSMMMRRKERTRMRMF